MLFFGAKTKQKTLSTRTHRERERAKEKEREGERKAKSVLRVFVLWEFVNFKCIFHDPINRMKINLFLNTLNKNHSFLCIQLKLLNNVSRAFFFSLYVKYSIN